MNRLAGKIAVITGGNSGIGLATAKHFVTEGADVIIIGRRQRELDKAIEQVGRNITAIQGDVSKLEDLDRIFAEIKLSKGRIDILFANAGLGDMAPLGEITEASFDLTFAVNVKGTLFTVQKALPLMKAGSTIVLTGSTTGVTGTPAFSVYSASKAALRNFARSWALDLKGTGIRVNVISPGPTATPAVVDGLAHADPQGNFINMLIAKTPLSRMGLPDEIAAAALFLASDESSFMTGSEMFVDGGYAQV